MREHSDKVDKNLSTFYMQRGNEWPSLCLYLWKYTSCFICFMLEHKTLEYIIGQIEVLHLYTGKTPSVCQYLQLNNDRQHINNGTLNIIVTRWVAGENKLYNQIPELQISRFARFPFLSLEYIHTFVLLHSDSLRWSVTGAADRQCQGMDWPGCTWWHLIQIHPYKF